VIFDAGGMDLVLLAYQLEESVEPVRPDCATTDGVGAAEGG
jgi:hypothetical protein